MECNGCQGKGWVETAGGAIVHVCPLCHGAGWLKEQSNTSAPIVGMS